MKKITEEIMVICILEVTERTLKENDILANYDAASNNVIAMISLSICIITNENSLKCLDTKFGTKRFRDMDEALIAQNSKMANVWFCTIKGFEWRFEDESPHWASND